MANIMYAYADGLALTQQDPSNRGQPYLSVFLSLLNVIAHYPNLLDRDKQRLAAVSGPLVSELTAAVKMCRMSKCYKQETSRFELAIGGEFADVADIFFRVVEKEKGRECYGQAPRSPLERQLLQLLVKA